MYSTMLLLTSKFQVNTVALSNLKLSIIKFGILDVCVEDPFSQVRHNS